MVFNYSGVASLFMLWTQDLYILQDTFWNASVSSFHILFFSSLNWASFSFKTFSSCKRVTEAQNNWEISLDVLAKIKREAKHMNSIKKCLAHGKLCCHSTNQTGDDIFAWDGSALDWASTWDLQAIIRASRLFRRLVRENSALCLISSM